MRESSDLNCVIDSAQLKFGGSFDGLLRVKQAMVPTDDQFPQLAWPAVQVFFIPDRAHYILAWAKAGKQNVTILDPAVDKANVNEAFNNTTWRQLLHLFKNRASRRGELEISWRYKNSWIRGPADTDASICCQGSFTTKTLTRAPSTIFTNSAPTSDASRRPALSSRCRVFLKRWHARTARPLTGCATSRTELVWLVSPSTGCSKEAMTSTGLDATPASFGITGCASGLLLFQTDGFVPPVNSCT
uniref:Uncharacterized protein n=1 Tax=Plectus sambesii TaxID=2011161 RepID=A0A914X8N6_9BILA